MKRPRSPTARLDTNDQREQEHHLAAAQALLNVCEGSADKALLAACKEGLVDVAACLVKELGANVKASNRIGWTPLHIAAIGGFCEVARMLVKEFGQDTSGKTPLHRACENSHCAMVSLLVKELGASIKVLDTHGGCPPHCRKLWPA